MNVEGTRIQGSGNEDLSLMAVSGAPAPAPLENSSWILACVDGLDRGCIIPLSSPDQEMVFGRDISLVTDSQVSREHCELLWDDHEVFIRERLSTNGTRIRRAKTQWVRPLGTAWVRLHVWDQVLVGSSLWQLRQRSVSLLPPSDVQRPIRRLRFRKQHSLSGRRNNATGHGVPRPWRGWRGALTLLPLIFLAVSLGRILSHIPHVYVGAGLGVLVLALSTLMIRRWFARDQQLWDGALMVEHMQHCASLPQQSQQSRPSPWLYANPLALFDSEAGGAHPIGRAETVLAPSIPGYCGNAAILQLLWDCAAYTRLWGGCVVRCREGSLSCGNGSKEIHVCDEGICPVCNDKEWDSSCAHIAIAQNHGELPTWCDAVFIVDEPPVSMGWVSQVFSPLSTQDAQSAPLQTVLAVDLWSENESVLMDERGTLLSVLGRKAHGEKLIIDLIKDGPHGVIVGTTGSGKSEAFITLLMGMARTYSPEVLRFVLIDYKGGTSLGPLAALPHVHDLLTDLEPQRTLRAFEGLRALIDTREKQLAEAGFASLSLWESQDPESAPPRVVIACDEFTTFADLHTELFDDILRWTAQGRALGIHILLATQRPDRALASSILANIDLRIALRCREVTASQTLVGTDQAAHLPPIPGRAVVEGHGIIQCAWIPNLQETCQALGQIWQGVEKIRPLWLDPLPKELPVSALSAKTQIPVPSGSVLIGLSDGIRCGVHQPLIWKGGHIRFEGMPHSQERINDAVKKCAQNLATALDLPFYDFSDHRQWPALSIIDTLSHNNSPTVIAIPDEETFQGMLSEQLGSLHSLTLWNEALRRCSANGTTFIVGTTRATSLWDKEARVYTYRFLNASSPQFLTQWGLPPRTVCPTNDEHFLLVQAPHEPGNTTLTLPCIAAIASPDQRNPACAIPATTQETQVGQGSLVVTRDPSALSVDPSCRVLRPQQWPQFDIESANEILVLQLTDDCRRSLSAAAYASDWALKVRHLPESHAIHIVAGDARLIERRNIVNI